MVGTLLRIKSGQRRVEAVNPAINQQVAYLFLFRPVLFRKSVLAHNPIFKLPNSFDHLVAPYLPSVAKGTPVANPSWFRTVAIRPQALRILALLRA